MKIEVIENVMQYNKEEADINRGLFKTNKVCCNKHTFCAGRGQDNPYNGNHKKAWQKI